MITSFTGIVNWIFFSLGKNAFELSIEQKGEKNF
jgi:hypothetical protein